MFVAYSYLADMLERIAGVAPAHVGWWMMAFGAIGLIGNWIGGTAVDRSPPQGHGPIRAAVDGEHGCRHTLGELRPIRLYCFSILGYRQYSALSDLPGASHELGEPLSGPRRDDQRLCGQRRVGIGAIIGGLTIQTTGIASAGYVAAAAAGLALLVVPLVSRLARAK